MELEGRRSDRRDCGSLEDERASEAVVVAAVVAGERMKGM